MQHTVFHPFTSMNLRIRQLKHTDCSVVADLWLKGLSQTTNAFEGRLFMGPFATWAMNNLGEKSKQPDSHVGLDGCNLMNFWTGSDRDFFVAECEEDSSIVGCLGVKRGTKEDLAEPESKQASVWMVSVAESARRKGVGRDLMLKAEDWAKKQIDPPIDEMCLMTMNPHAHNFYLRLGYEANGWIVPSMSKKLIH